MRKVKTSLRLHFEAGFGNQKIATSQDVGYGTVTNYIKRANAAGVTRPLLLERVESELSAILFPTASSRRNITFSEPDFSRAQIELRCKGLTLLLLWQKYREAHPDNGYSYSQH